MGWPKFAEDIESIINNRRFENDYADLVHQVEEKKKQNTEIPKSNPNLGFKFQDPRCVPVILLLDTSKSMQNNDKIGVLNAATKEMLSTFALQDDNNVVIKVAIYTFGPDVKQILPLTAASDAVYSFHDMEAHGGTLLGGALKMVKSNLIEDRNKITSRDYRPQVILVSDGMPGDDWRKAIDEFCNSGRSSKCLRMAMGIGVEKGTAPHTVLSMFTGNDKMVFSAKDSKSIRNFFKYVTMTTIQKSIGYAQAANEKEKEIPDEDSLAF